ncbi:MAG: peptide-modifying radical SAM enzyme CbpB [Actinomycetota bacterium]|nr:peptide-modifying radical SAM enzyme CbpB [Actinomycetota bacterium]
MTALFANTGGGPALVPIDIGHDKYMALVEPDTAFWSLVRKDRIAEVLADPVFVEQVHERGAGFAAEMDALRFGLVPSAVYFNPTERCNLNCTYCYLPETMRRHGVRMTEDRLFEALETLLAFFRRHLPDGVRPQVIFHGSEPMLNRRAVFAAIDRFAEEIVFGVQTNGTLLDPDAIEFLTSREISLGLSLDGPLAEITDRTRRTHAGRGVHDQVVGVLEMLRGYHNHAVICTTTTDNLAHLSEVVELFHALEVPTCMLNPVRCTLPGGQMLRPSDDDLTSAYLGALDRSYALYRQTGRKLVVANFANVVLAVIAPTARRLMCDISPCGAGRCFFAVDAHGDLFPCSEFIGLSGFRGGNLFTGGLESCSDTDAFRSVTGRMVETIDPCRGCSIRHFCGAPCPAEAHELHGDLARRGAYCQFYEAQLRYALRLVADGREDAYLSDGWDTATTTVLDMTVPWLTPSRQTTTGGTSVAHPKETR